MTDFKKITQAEVVGRLDILPPQLLAILDGKEYREKTETILREIESDTPENRQLFSAILGYIVLGILPNYTEDLGEDLNVLLRLQNKENSEILADKFLDILDPALKLIRENAQPLGSFVAAEPKDMAKAESTTFTPPKTTATLPSGLTGGAVNAKPFFIHSETAFAPLAKEKEGAETKVSLGQKITSLFKSAKSTPPSAGTAKIAISGMSTPKPPVPEGIMKTEVAAPRIVHYGEMKTTLGKTPMPPSTSGKSAPVPLGSIGRNIPSPAPMRAPSSQPVPARPPQPAPHAPAPAPVRIIDDPARELPAAPATDQHALPNLPGIKGVPPIPPKPPVR